MALEVTITITGQSTSYLKCDVIDHSFTRMVTQTGLPSEGETTAPTENGVFLLDLGVCIEQITLTGVVDDVPSDGSISRNGMEIVVRSWWAFGDTSSNLLKIGFPTSSTQYYYGAIRNSTFRKTAGVPGRWEFSVGFLVKSKV